MPGLLGVGVLCAVVVGAYGELSWQAFVAVAATGLLVAALAVLRRAGAGAPPVGRRGLGWATWLVVAAAVEATTLAHPDLPTLSDLADPLLADGPVRAAATLVWLAAGAWLLTRPATGRGR